MDRIVMEGENIFSSDAGGTPMPTPLQLEVRSARVRDLAAFPNKGMPTIDLECVLDVDSKMQTAAGQVLDGARWSLAVYRGKQEQRYAREHEAIGIASLYAATKITGWIGVNETVFDRLFAALISNTNPASIVLSVPQLDMVDHSFLWGAEDSSPLTIHEVSILYRRAVLRAVEQPLLTTAEVSKDRRLDWIVGLLAFVAAVVFFK